MAKEQCIQVGHLLEQHTYQESMRLRLLTNRKGEISAVHVFTVITFKICSNE